MGDIDKLIYRNTEQGDLRLHVFRPEADAPTGAIVFFFGGGWTGGTPEQFYPFCRYLSDQGMFAAAAEYRIKSIHGTGPEASVEDGRAAVQWLRGHANELNIDPDRIAAAGGSAGGHVAACAGVLSAAGDEAGVSSAPDAMVLFNPVLDTSPETGFGSDRFVDPRGCSPVHHVRSGICPTIIYHGTADTTVSFASAEAFRNAMETAGNSCRLIPFEGAEHGFFNYREGDNPHYESTLHYTYAFLTHRGFL